MIVDQRLLLDAARLGFFYYLGIEQFDPRVLIGGWISVSDSIALFDSRYLFSSTAGGVGNFSLPLESPIKQRLVELSTPLPTLFN